MDTILEEEEQLITAHRMQARAHALVCGFVVLVVVMVFWGGCGEGGGDAGRRVKIYTAKNRLPNNSCADRGDDGRCAARDGAAH